MATGLPRAAASTSSAPPASSFTGAPLVRLLARMAGPDASAAGAPFAERLGQWLHWTDAAALHEAIDGPAPPLPVCATAVDAAELAQALQHLREAARRAIEADCDLVHADVMADDWQTWRRILVSRVQAVQASLPPLRARLRAALTSQLPAAPNLVRLAAVDGVMERALGAQERALLTNTLPSLLQRHVDQLRSDGTDVNAWREPFCQELRAVLLAALDLSLQPLEGLLAALRAGHSSAS